ncbi:MAG: hypothetical protein IMZ71_05050 [Chloroflexi bacterium]|nr:hypothetical protein [Chloroflexota bacterium]
MKIIAEPISLPELRTLARGRFGHLVKAVVDIRREVMAVDGELHADLEALLLEDSSQQQDVWGINLYPDLEGDDRIDFDSLINLRPSAGNRTRGVEDVRIQAQIRKVVHRWVNE